MLSYLDPAVYDGLQHSLYNGRASVFWNTWISSFYRKKAAAFSTCCTMEGIDHLQARFFPF
jgi:hypothetical protein